jgi:hypothetical protein
MDVAARTLLASSLVLLVGCPPSGGTATQTGVTDTDTSGPATTGSGSASEASATLPTTTDPTADPATTTSTTSSTGAVSVTDGTTDGTTTEGASTTTSSTSSDTTGDTTGDTPGDTTGSTTGDTTGSTTDDSTGTSDTTTGGTTGGDEEPFFPACDVLAIGEPITLEDLSEPGNRKPPAPLAYDGQDLVIVREDWNPMSNKCEHLFERRDPTTGALLGPGVRTPGIGVCGWNGALGHDPVSDTFLFLSQTNGTTLGLTALDAKGGKLWQRSEWALCNSFVQSMNVASRGGEWVVMGETYHCGVGDRFTSVQAYTLGGERKYWLKTPTANAAAGFAACNLPTCDRALTLRYGNEGQDSGMWAQMGDLVAGKLDVEKTKLSGQAYGGWDASAAAWNGTDWLIIRVEDTGPSQKAHVARWDENLGWTTPITTFGSGESPTEFELLWTGHDYVGAYAEFPDLNMQLPDNWYDMDIYIFLIGPDGKLKKNQLFERAKGFGGYAPQLVPLPGAIGLSWVRVTKNPNNSLSYSRHYGRITCAG